MSEKYRAPSALLAFLLIVPSLASPEPAEVPDGGRSYASPNWNEMERTTIELSFVTLAGCWNTDPDKTVYAVSDLLWRMFPRQEIAWGPALHQPNPDIPGTATQRSDALALITRDFDTGEYFVIFRGTNTVSAVEWAMQDFMVQRMIPWSAIQRGAAPADAMISEGASTAIKMRLELAPGRGCTGEGESLAKALVRIVEDSNGRCVMHFTGHSLGGLLAPVMALWLKDQLVLEGRQDLLDKLDLDVYSYAAPTAGNKSFASYLAYRVPEQRRYACDLDVVPQAWQEDTIELMPEIYKPSIEMELALRPLYNLCLSFARGKGYAQPMPRIDVPSRVVRAKGDLYILEAAYQHMMPYLDMMLPERKAEILRSVIQPLIASVTIVGVKPVDLQDIYAMEE
jgi:Lipase (class 3).